MATGEPVYPEQIVEGDGRDTNGAERILAVDTEGKLILA